MKKPKKKKIKKKIKAKSSSSSKGNVNVTVHVDASKTGEGVSSITDDVNQADRSLKKLMLGGRTRI